MTEADAEDPETLMPHWRLYDTLDSPVSTHIGLLEMAKHKLLRDNDARNEEDDD